MKKNYNYYLEVSFWDASIQLVVKSKKECIEIGKRAEKDPKYYGIRMYEVNEPVYNPIKNRNKYKLHKGKINVK